MQIYDDRCERPNFAPCKSPLLIAHAIFLSRMTNIAVKTLVVSYQTCIFVEHHITKERLKPREQTVAVAHTESTPRLKTPKAPMVCRESEKNGRNISPRCGSPSPFTDSFLSFEHEHCPPFPKSAAILRRRFPTNDLG